MDTILIQGLAVSTRIGVHRWEQQIDQRLVLNIEISQDLSICDDSLEKTIDYAALCERVTAFISSQSFKLIETVAEKTAQLLKDEFAVAQVCVTVNKGRVIANVENVAVRVVR